MKKKLAIFGLSAILAATVCTGLLVGCTDDPTPEPPGPDVVTPTYEFGEKWNENLVPDDNKVWFFAGQDMDAVGGLEGYENGYADYFGIPAGISTYTGWKGGGLSTKSVGTSGDMHAKAYADSEAYKNCMILIGLQLGGVNLKAIPTGVDDANIQTFADFFKSCPNTHFFLRIGYEFDLSSYNYDPAHYAEAFRYIVTKLRELGVENVKYVWCSTGAENEFTDAEETRLMQYYPGDEYVDWVGYSFFGPAHTGNAMRRIGEKHHKPVFICEATPRGDNLEDESNANICWSSGWWHRFLNHVKSNPSIRAVAYINQDWESQPMWIGQGWGNTRLQANKITREAWAAEITSKNNIFVHKEVKINAEKEYVPTFKEELVYQLQSGTAVEAEWAKTAGGAAIETNKDANCGKYVKLPNSDASLTYFVLPAGTSAKIGYSATKDGTMHFAFAGGKTHHVEFPSTEGYLDVFNLVNEKGGLVSVKKNQTIQITVTSDAPVYIDAIYIQTNGMFNIYGTQIEETELSGGAAHVGGFTNGGVQLAGAAGDQLGTAKYVADRDGDAIAIVYARGAGGNSSNALTVNGEPVQFCNLVTSDWTKFVASIVPVKVKAGDEIVISRASAMQSVMNLDGVVVLDLKMFKGEVKLPQEEYLPVVGGTKMTASMGAVVGTTVEENGNLVLDQKGQSLSYYRLFTSNKANLIYSAQKAGTITVYANGTSQKVALEATDELAPFKNAKITTEAIKADSFLRIAFEEGDTPITIVSVVIDGYLSGATIPVPAGTLEWDPEANGGNSATAGYPAFKFLTEADVVLESSQAAYNGIALVGAAQGKQSITVTVGNITKTAEYVFRDWGLFVVAYVDLGETVPAGTKITVRVNGGINVAAIYGVDMNTLKTEYYSEDQSAKAVSLTYDVAEAPQKRKNVAAVTVTVK